MKKNNLFFAEQTWYQILKIINNSSFVTQREIAVAIHSTSSVAHYYIDQLEEEGLITRKYISSKSILYNLTNEGLVRFHQLTNEYLSMIRNYHADISSLISHFYEKIIHMKIKKVILIGTNMELENMNYFLKEPFASNLEIVGGVLLDNGEKKIDALRFIEKSFIYKELFDAVVVMNGSLNNRENQDIFELPVIKSKIIPFI